MVLPLVVCKVVVVQYKVVVVTVVVMEQVMVCVWWVLIAQICVGVVVDLLGLFPLLLLRCVVMVLGLVI